MDRVCGVTSAKVGLGLGASCGPGLCSWGWGHGDLPDTCRLSGGWHAARHRPGVGKRPGGGGCSNPCPSPAAVCALWGRRRAPEGSCPHLSPVSSPTPPAVGTPEMLTVLRVCAHVHVRYPHLPQPPGLARDVVAPARPWPLPALPPRPRTHSLLRPRSAVRSCRENTSLALREHFSFLFLLNKPRATFQNRRRKRTRSGAADLSSPGDARARASAGLRGRGRTAVSGRRAAAASSRPVRGPRGVFAQAAGAAADTRGRGGSVPPALRTSCALGLRACPWSPPSRGGGASQTSRPGAFPAQAAFLGSRAHDGGDWLLVF